MMLQVQCRKCRQVLCTTTVKYTSDKTCGGSHFHFDCLENVPPWMKLTIEQGSFIKGKFHCTKCSTKVGAFDFTSSSTCKSSDTNETGDTSTSIYLIVSKVDISSVSSVPKSVSKLWNPSSLRTRPQSVDSEELSAACCSSQMALPADEAAGHDDSSLFQNETLEFGKKKVSEVALSITRKGRECVANLCASVDANITVHLSDLTDKRNRQAQNLSPVTSDEESESSINDAGAGSLLNPLSSLSDALLLGSVDNEGDASRESTPDLESKPKPVVSEVQVPSDDEDQDKDNDVNSVNPEPFSCSVCLEIYYIPQKCIPCDHVFCDPCLRQVNHSSSASGAKCPLCRVTIKRCKTYEELWTATKTLFPAEYQERHKVEKRKRRNRGSLPGSNDRGSRLNRRANGGSNGLKTWAGVCFVLLFMMLGFTVFATTVGFVLWYLVEIAMDLLVDLTLEFQTFSEVFKTSIILFCIDGGLSREKWNTLYESGSRVIGAFTKLVHPKNFSYPTLEPLTNINPTATNENSYEMLWKLTQTYIANYVVFGCLVTFLLYRLAKFMQARRV